MLNLFMSPENNLINTEQHFLKIMKMFEAIT